MFIQVCFTYYQWTINPAEATSIYLTHWGVFFTTMSLVFSLQASETHIEPFGMLPDKTLAMLLMQVAGSLNFLITLVSWTIIIPANLARERPFDDNEGVVYMINKVAVHTLPFVFSSVNMFGLTDMTAYFRDTWVLFPVMAVYMTLAYTPTPRLRATRSTTF